MSKLICLGEILIDFTPVKIDSLTFYEKNPGGAPANVSVAFSRLGGKSAFIGKVGNDDFGRFLKITLEKNGVDTSALRFTDKSNTTLAFVNIDEKGERSFTFYRKPGADTLLSIKDLNFNLIKNSKIFHFGSLSMTDNPAYKATLFALHYAKKNRKIISFDPNLRPPLWKDLNIAKKKIENVLNQVDILKLSEEELFFITGKDNINIAIDLLEKTHKVSLILLTLGEKGALYSFNGIRKKFDSYRIKVVDTTGAGDAFLGGFLFSILKENFFEKKSTDILDRAMNFANATAAITVSRRGAIPALPSLDEVKNLMEACKSS